MSNPFNAINPMNRNMGNIQNDYQMLMNAKNPMQVFNQLAMNNPQMQPIIQALQMGQNPQQLFNNLCRQRGIDPQQFLNQIKGVR